MSEQVVTAQCRSCRHFRNDPGYLETVFPGLTSLSSGYGSVSADDGVCLLHDRYLRASSSCPSFAAAVPASHASGRAELDINQAKRPKEAGR